MFTIGQELYRLTNRDEETLLIEPFFRTLIANIPAGVGASGVSFSVPIDRCLYLGMCSLRMTPGAAQRMISVFMELQNTAAVVFQKIWEVNGDLTGDYNAASVLGTTVSFNLYPQIILPPGSTLRVSGEKLPVANAGIVNATVSGYLIPPGRIGRVF